MDSGRRIVKRRYSRAGCIECKRRKIKCNEEHPICGNCARVKFPCVYPDDTQYNRPRRQRHNPTTNTTTPEEVTASSLADSTVKMEDIQNTKIDVLDTMLLFENVFDDASTLVHGLADFDMTAMDHASAMSDGSMSGASTNGNGNAKPFSPSTILNGPSKDNVFFDEIELEDYLKNGTDIGTNPELAHMWNQFSVHMSAPLEPEHEYTNVELIAKITEHYKLSKEELEYFRTVSCRDLFFYIYPFASSIDNNEVMYVLLEYLMVFKYLVYALIALGASCLFTITGDRKHDHNQKKYTAICMRLLVAAFGDLKSNEYSLWHIEGLILTVLALTMLFSDMSFVDTTQVPVSWISHLKEARELLIKYNSVKSKSNANKPDSPGITIARLLFFCFDWMSKLSMPVREITTEDLNDLWLLSGDTSFKGLEPLAYYRTMLKLGVMIPETDTHSGFNLFLTFTKEVISTVYRIIDVVSACNSEGLLQVAPEKITEIMAQIDLAFQQKIVPGIKAENNYLIEKTNPAHPQYADVANRIILPLSAYGKDVDCEGSETLYYSWCDIAQRLHVYFLYLKVLTSPGLLYLPRSHPMIKSTVKEVLELMFFLKPKCITFRPELAVAESPNYYLCKSLFDYRAIMVQLPFRMCLDLTDNEDEFEKLELFFRGLVKFGSGNCTMAVARAKKNRAAARKRKAEGGKEGNDLNYLAEGYPVY